MEKKPLLLFTSQDANGHAGPLIYIAGQLIKRGYEVAYLAGSAIKDSVQKSGAEIFETTNAFQYITPQQLEEIKNEPSNLARFCLSLSAAFLASIPEKTQILGDTLEKLRERDPTRQIIVIGEALNMSVYAFKLGRPPPKNFNTFPKVITINVIPLWLKSTDSAPFNMGLPPDSSESGRLRNEALWDLQMEYGPWSKSLKVEREALSAAGATELPSVCLDAMLTASDVAFQLCSAEMEYPRPDQPAHIKFAGCFLPRAIDPNYIYPEWWSDIKENPGKKIVFVAQGTAQTNPKELLMPTIEAFDGRDDIIVIATLGVRGSSLPESFKVPSNAKVFDYFLYEVALSVADVFVTNGGYGGLTQSVVHAVPLVVAGLTQDKSEVSRRVEWLGIGEALWTQTPSPQKVREGVDKVLNDSKYKDNITEMCNRNREQYDALSIIEQQIVEFTE